ncbi:MAG: hypothetical protein J5I90_11915 [Caldilineales bacterium]|nr:hypothetical protein [Caldilineales bacterium]
MKTALPLKLRYLIVPVVILILAISIGNAASLTVNSGGQNVVTGTSNAYAADTATVTYTIDTAGNVIAAVTTSDSYDYVSADFGAGSGYQACSGSDTSWTCTLSHADIAGSTAIAIIGTAND